MNILEPQRQKAHERYKNSNDHTLESSPAAWLTAPGSTMHGPSRAAPLHLEVPTNQGRVDDTRRAVHAQRPHGAQVIVPVRTDARQGGQRKAGAECNQAKHPRIRRGVAQRMRETLGTETRPPGASAGPRPRRADDACPTSFCRTRAHCAQSLDSSEKSRETAMQPPIPPDARTTCAANPQKSC